MIFSFLNYDLLEKQLNDLKSLFVFEKDNLNIKYYKNISKTTEKIMKFLDDINILHIFIDFHFFKIFIYEKDKYFNNKVFEKVLCKLESFENEEQSYHLEFINDCFSYFACCLEYLNNIEWFSKRRNRFLRLFFIFSFVFFDKILMLLKKFLTMECALQMNDDDVFLREIIKFKKYQSHYTLNNYCFKLSTFAAKIILPKIRIKFIKYLEIYESSRTNTTGNFVFFFLNSITYFIFRKK